MKRIPIIPRNLDSPLCELGVKLPVDYMGDYSVMGLKVGRYREAVRILAENRFSITTASRFSEIELQGPGQVADVVRVLRAHRIDCGLTDIADQLYQG